MRSLVERLMGIWPLNRMMTLLWRYFPFPRGIRSRIMRTANDNFLVGVIAVIEDEHGRFLLVRNTYDPRHAWSLPGGWMGRREQPEECIRRELLEETGYIIEVDEMLAAYTRPRLPSVDLVFRGRIISGTFRPSAEVHEAQFFGIDEVPDRTTMTHVHMLRALADARQKHEPV